MMSLRLWRRWRLLAARFVAVLPAVLLLVGALLPLPASAALLHLEGPIPADLGLHQGHLAPCPTPAHCAREDWAVADPAAALERLLPAVLALDGVELVETGEGYLHATATSRLFGFVDDLELHATPGAGLIEARSVSRLGDSDLGVNARRLATLRQALTAG
jgi:uncharacterized protein (DUF1499 family)